MCKKHTNVSRQAYNFPEVKLRRLRRKTYEEKYDIRDKNLRTILAIRRAIACSFIKQPGPASQYMMQVKQHVHGKFRILSLESQFLETYLALEVSLNNV